jgi:hypothetical protein
VGLSALRRSPAARRRDRAVRPQYWLSIGDAEQDGPLWLIRPLCDYVARGPMMASMAAHVAL